MVFVKDSAPEKELKKIGPGGKLHVLGIPRIDLALVSWRTQHAQQVPGVLNWNLPYEMVIVGVYPN